MKKPLYAGKIKLDCKICKKEFYVYPYRKNKAKYCSFNCFHKAGFSKDIRLKMSLRKIGKHISPQTQFKKGQVSLRKGKKYLKISGKKHWNWQGGKTEEKRKIRSSLEYKLWRDAVFIRDNWTCIWCFQRGGRLEADHIKPFYLYPELRLAIDNGRTLCVDCHRKTDTWGNSFRDKLGRFYKV